MNFRYFSTYITIKINYDASFGEYPNLTLADSGPKNPESHTSVYHYGAVDFVLEWKFLSYNFKHKSVNVVDVHTHVYLGHDASKYVRNLCENMYRLSSFMFIIC
jgi:hypothetical protein